VLTVLRHRAGVPQQDSSNRVMINSITCGLALSKILDSLERKGILTPLMRSGIEDLEIVRRDFPSCNAWALLVLLLVTTSFDCRSSALPFSLMRFQS